MTHSGTPQNEPFVSGQDRPPTTLHPDTPLSELRVRDLTQLLAQQGNLKKVEKLEIAKEIKTELKQEKLEKLEHKEKPEKFEHKEKPEKFEHKEKPEKFEHKEKPEKVEHKEKPEKFEQLEKVRLDQVPKFSELGDPGPVTAGGDPRIDQLIQSVSDLQQQMQQMQQGQTGG